MAPVTGMTEAMTVFGFLPSDMSAASAAVTDATASARGADGADALATVASALPGTQTADYMSELGSLWKAGTQAWCDDVEAFGAGVAETARDGSATDGGVGNLFDGMSLLFGGS